MRSQSLCSWDLSRSSYPIGLLLVRRLDSGSRRLIAERDADVLVARAALLKASPDPDGLRRTAYYGRPRAEVMDVVGFPALAGNVTRGACSRSTCWS